MESRGDSKGSINQPGQLWENIINTLVDIRRQSNANVERIEKELAKKENDEIQKNMRENQRENMSRRRRLEGRSVVKERKYKRYYDESTESEDDPFHAQRLEGRREHMDRRKKGLIGDVYDKSVSRDPKLHEKGPRKPTNTLPNFSSKAKNPVPATTAISANSENSASISKPQPSAAKKLNNEELQDFTKRGLCFKCSAMWRIGHKCSSGQAHVDSSNEEPEEHVAEISDSAHGYMKIWTAVRAAKSKEKVAVFTPTTTRDEELSIEESSQAIIFRENSDSAVVQPENSAHMSAEISASAPIVSENAEECLTSEIPATEGRSTSVIATEASANAAKEQGDITVDLQLQREDTPAADFSAENSATAKFVAPPRSSGILPDSSNHIEPIHSQEDAKITTRAVINIQRPTTMQLTAWIDRYEREGREVEEEMKAFSKLAYFLTGTSTAALMAISSGYLEGQTGHAHTVALKVCTIFMVVTFLTGCRMLFLILSRSSHISIKSFKSLKWTGLLSLILSVFSGAILYLKMFALLAFFIAMILFFMA
ncbi:uncharacterized protein LOC103700537 isoform X2 [Phoenix dactylifera]|uniref:Uncharacterized protein LOC103700537 isoform X2 n=1 Tax=Phoenix dactylifera TaxID=42345 RepID=A0A8B8ZV02_PHODC|nr:uncharacterized protein LOC103700537 isoform X2 [Phoenix dactylifera]